MQRCRNNFVVSKRIKKATQIVWLKGFVGLPGFEPRHTEPKSVVLPLYYRPILNWVAKIVGEMFLSKKIN